MFGFAFFLWRGKEAGDLVRGAHWHWDSVEGFSNARRAARASAMPRWDWSSNRLITPGVQAVSTPMGRTELSDDSRGCITPESGLLPASGTGTPRGFRRPTRGRTGPRHLRRQSRTPTHRPDGSERDHRASPQPRNLSKGTFPHVEADKSTDVDILHMSGFSPASAAHPPGIAVAATLPEHPCPGLHRSYRRCSVRRSECPRERHTRHDLGFCD